MNLFELVFKQMRQRALGTWLTLLSVLLGVALATAVSVFQREGERLFTQADFGYDLIVGPARGSPLQLTLNTVYNLDVSPGLVDYKVYKDLLADRRQVRLAIPIAKGDTYAGLPLIGTVPRMFNFTNDEGEAGPQPIPTEGDNALAPFEYARGKSFELATGRMFHPLKFEAVLGSDVTKLTNLKVGETFKATHGTPKPGQTPDIHDQEWKVVGQLKRTGTAADRSIYISLVSFLAISEHEETLKAIDALNKGADVGELASPQKPATSEPGDGHDHDHDHGEGQFHLHDGYIHLDIPEEDWKLSAILVRTRSAPLAFSLKFQIDNTNQGAASFPGEVMRKFFGEFLKPSTQVLLSVAALVSLVAGIGILVSIYNSVSARMREIAILRSLGATRGRILLIICTEAALIGLIGSVAGILVGHVLVAVGAGFVPDNLGQINPLRFTSIELLYLGGVVVLSVVAGLVPALKAYRVPVSENLTA